jgi:hypothetical protein
MWKVLKCGAGEAWTSRVRNEDMLHKVERNILHTTKRKRSKLAGHILRRNCLLKCVLKGKVDGGIKVMGR